MTTALVGRLGHCEHAERLESQQRLRQPHPVANARDSTLLVASAAAMMTGPFPKVVDRALPNAPYTNVKSP